MSEKTVSTLENALLSKLTLRYDNSKNRLAGYDVNIGANTNTYDFVYNTADTLRPDMIMGMKRNGQQVISYSYDGLNRLSSRTLNGYTTEYAHIYKTKKAVREKRTAYIFCVYEGSLSKKYLLL